MRFGPKRPRKPVQQTQLAEVAVRATSSQARCPNVPFADVTRQAGIHFRHANAATGRKLLPETMGGGCAFFDFDNDGDQDLLFVNSLDHWPWDESRRLEPSVTRRKSPPRPGGPATATSALYRNDGKGNFEDVTAGSGLDVSLYGMGVAVGDYDNDGRVDVFISALGTNRLFHNEGDGKFRDVTDEAASAATTMSGAPAAAGSTTTTTATSICSSATTSSGRASTTRARIFSSPAAGGPMAGRRISRARSPISIATTASGRFREVAKEAGLHVRNPEHRRAAGQVAGRRVRRCRSRTAGSTSSSPTTPCKTSCCTTKATARFARSRPRPASRST